MGLIPDHASSKPPPGSLTDEDDGLVARAKLDPQAFAPLYDRYLDPIYRYCYRRLNSRQAAEDATSQVFYRALSALPSYRNGSFRSWLFAIAHNVVVDIYRRQRQHSPIETAGDPADCALTPEELVLAAERHHSLDTLLSQLPDAQRHVLELRLAGLTGVEIAQAMGRSHGAVRALQFRAIERLRSVLDIAIDSPGG